MVIKPMLEHCLFALQVLKLEGFKELKFMEECGAQHENCSRAAGALLGFFYENNLLSEEAIWSWHKSTLFIDGWPTIFYKNVIIVYTGALVSCLLIETRVLIFQTLAFIATKLNEPGQFKAVAIF